MNNSFNKKRYDLMQAHLSSMYRLLQKISSEKEVWTIREVKNLLKSIKDSAEYSYF